jgi:hypothetical protein
MKVKGLRPTSWSRIVGQGPPSGGPIGAIVLVVEAWCPREIAVLITEPAPNGFPALPVREGESVVVTVLGFDDAAHQRRYRAQVRPADDAIQLLRLEPTERSRLGRSP